MWVAALAIAVGMWGLVVIITALAATYVARTALGRPFYPE